MLWLKRYQKYLLGLLLTFSLSSFALNVSSYTKTAQSIVLVINAEQSFKSAYHFSYNNVPQQGTIYTFDASLLLKEVARKVLVLESQQHQICLNKKPSPALTFKQLLFSLNYDLLG